MHQTQRHSNELQFDVTKHSLQQNNFARGKNIFVAELDDYERYRSMLYALGAQSVSSKMMANVNVIVYGGASIPPKAKAKYPAGEFVRSELVLPLFHAEIQSFAEYVHALEKYGFHLRNPSDEADARFDFFDLPTLDSSLPETLLDYLRTSHFIRQFATKQYFPIDTRENGYVEFPIPTTDVTWYYQWRNDAWNRVSAFRGDGDYPLEIKGDQLLRVARIFWRESAGMYFHEYPCIDSISGLFIIAGIDARTGRVNGAAISRIWT